MVRIHSNVSLNNERKQRIDTYQSVKPNSKTKNKKLSTSRVKKCDSGC